MHLLTIVSLGFAGIVLIQQTNADGNGCAWSGCSYGPACTTGVTGQSGRWKFRKSVRCGIWPVRGSKRFCCDSDCEYRECGKTCESLGQRGHWGGEMPPVGCTFEIPGYGLFVGTSQFCCG